MQDASVKNADVNDADDDDDDDDDDDGDEADNNHGEVDFEDKQTASGQAYQNYITAKI